MKLSALSGVVHETQVNREDTRAEDAPVPEGSFRCEECFFINANLRLQCKQCMHLRFKPFDTRQLAVAQKKGGLKNTSGVLKTRGALGKKWVVVHELSLRLVDDAGGTRAVSGACVYSVRHPATQSVFVGRSSA